MKVKIVKQFNDAELNIMRNIGEVVEVTEERAKVLLGDNKYKEAFVEVVETIVEDKPKKTRKTTKK